jgi:hypothetical protein
VGTFSSATALMWRDLGIVVGAALLSLALASVTLRRRST